VLIAAAKDQPGRLAGAQRQFRRNRRIGAAADAIRAEVLASHGPLSPVELLSPIIGQIDGQNLQKKACAILPPAKNKPPAQGPAAQSG